MYWQAPENWWCTCHKVDWSSHGTYQTCIAWLWHPRQDALLGVLVTYCMMWWIEWQQYQAIPHIGFDALAMFMLSGCADQNRNLS
jgi:hypothetical protein